MTDPFDRLGPTAPEVATLHRLVAATDPARFQYNDGGRAAAGYVGKTGDCGVRALAIAVFGAQPKWAGIEHVGAAPAYARAVELVLRYAKTERKKRGRSAASSRSTTTKGIYGATMRRIMADPEVAARGWRWRSTMAIGGGCTTHLRADELPSGRLIVVVSKHFTTMIDGVKPNGSHHEQATPQGASTRRRTVTRSASDYSASTRRRTRICGQHAGQHARRKARKGGRERVVS